jgi:hypothetical protein
VLESCTHLLTLKVLRVHHFHPFKIDIASLNKHHVTDVYLTTLFQMHKIYEYRFCWMKMDYVYIDLAYIFVHVTTDLH